MLSVELSSGRVKTSLSEHSGTDTDTSSDSHPSSEDDVLDLTGRKLELSSIAKLEVWEGFGELVEKAKSRERMQTMRVRLRKRVLPKVIVDFGALSFVETRRESRKVEDDKEDAIRNALSLGEEGDLWCKNSYISCLCIL